MTTAMNAQAAISREEFDRTVEKLRAEMKAVASGRPVAGAADPERLLDEFVRKDEFRLFKWFFGLTLAAILSGFGLLYQEIAELRVAMERQYSDLRAEMSTGFRAITGDVDSMFTAHQRDMGSRITAHQRDMNSRITAHQRDMNSNFTTLQRDIAGVREQLVDVRERVARIETLLDVKNPDNPADRSAKGT